MTEQTRKPESDEQQKQGSQPKLETYNLTRWVFLRLLGVIHLMAFGSYATEIIGLNGSHGILPTQTLLLAASQQLGAIKYFELPTLAWINSSDAALQFMCIAGTSLSFFVIFGILTGPTLIVLMILWLSICTGGGEFTGFQSDGMLVEVTLLSLFFTPWCLVEPPWKLKGKVFKQRPPSVESLWLLRFMIFRLMFASGCVKLLSGDKTWRDLTAMEYHFETQPIPTPLAWFAFHLPKGILKSFSAGMFIAELLTPPFIFAKSRLRLAAAIVMIGLHVGIILTGNYTFLNYLNILLCIPLFNDSVFRRILPKALVESIDESIDTLSKSKNFVRAFTRIAAAVMLYLASSVLAITLAPGAIPQLLKFPVIMVAPLDIANSYGLFAVMTLKRPEIVFEGSENGSDWKAYEFVYKPGDDLKKAPPWVAPHMPRLDWRLWFAAMVPIRENLWVLQLSELMLQNRPEIQQFFSYNPFAKNPPKYLRAWVYDYHFTDEKQKAATGNWWWRDNKQQYLPAIYSEGGQLKAMLRPDTGTTKPSDAHPEAGEKHGITQE